MRCALHGYIVLFTIGQLTAVSTVFKIYLFISFTASSFDMFYENSSSTMAENRTKTMQTTSVQPIQEHHSPVSIGLTIIDVYCRENQPTNNDVIEN